MVRWEGEGGRGEMYYLLLGIPMVMTTLVLELTSDPIRTGSTSIVME